MNLKRISCVVLLLGAVAPSALAALKYPAEVGPVIGYLWREGDIDVENPILLGARFGTFISPANAIELQVLGGQSSIKNSDKEADTLLPTVEFQHHFRDKERWKTYLAGGLGYMQTNRDRTVQQNNIDFTVLYGIGAKYELTPHFLARFDGRHLINTESGTGTHSLLFIVGIDWIYGNDVVAPPPPKPVVLPSDADQDGVVDETDACPGTPPGTKVSENGCPVPVDSDGDGVFDDRDECPGTPAGTAVDALGCPQTAKPIPEKEWVLKGVHFKSGSDKLTADSIKGLEEAVEILTTHTRVRVEIQGNTDRTGPAELNMKLSHERADAVKTYLTGRGIDESRLTTRGLGFTNPIASNKTAEGRAKNRRIEFKVLSR